MGLVVGEVAEYSLKRVGLGFGFGFGFGHGHSFESVGYFTKCKNCSKDNAWYTMYVIYKCSYIMQGKVNETKYNFGIKIGKNSDTLLAII